MFARYVCSITTGTAVTLMLLYVMQVLILFQEPVTSSADAPRFFLRPVRLIPTPPPPPERNEFTRLRDPLPAPPRRGGPTLPVEPVAPFPGVPKLPGVPRGLQEPGIDPPSDSPLIRVLAVQPAYPVHASRRGIEGWVEVAFDVQPDGSVTNATVIASSHAFFERSALEAVARFRFRARIVDGVPQPSTGLRNRFVFRMDDV